MTYKKSSFLKPLAVYASVMTLVACTGAKKQTLNPPKVPRVGKLEMVAISSFDGKDGALFRKELQSLLLNDKLGGFVVVTSSKKADGVFSGRVVDSSVSSRSYSKEIEDCDREGLLRRCKEGTQRKYNVQCVDRAANFQVVVSATKVKTGEVIYSSTTTGKQTDTHCQNQSTTPVSDSALLQKARAKALEKIRKDVAPYYTDK
jgi:hypothetical protein